jgi:L-fuconolactonase
VEIVAAAGKAVDLHVAFEQLPFVAALASGYPQTSFVMDHMGYPVPGQTTEETYRAAVDCLAALPNVHAKISGFELKSASGYPFDDMIFFARCMIESFGTGRCMWGSNYPYINNCADIGGAVSIAERLLEDQGDLSKEHFFSRTARRVFWGEEAVG